MAISADNDSWAALILIEINTRLKVAIILVFACIAPFIAWGDEEVIVDASAPHHHFPHYWEQMFGSGRAILTLRDSYRRDLRLVKGATDLKFVRFHAILHD